MVPFSIYPAEFDSVLLLKYNGLLNDLKNYNCFGYKANSCDPFFYIKIIVLDFSLKVIDFGQ